MYEIISLDIKSGNLLLDRHNYSNIELSALSIINLESKNQVTVN